MVPSNDWLSSRDTSVATHGGNIGTTDIDPKEQKLQVRITRGSSGGNKLLYVHTYNNNP